MTKNPRAAKHAAAGQAATKKPAVKQPAAKKPAAKTAASAPKAANEKVKKPKLVRDSFTMPESEYALFNQLKKACIAAGFEIKKSELLRIGVALTAKLDPKKLQAAQQALTPLKAGRPKKK